MRIRGDFQKLDHWRRAFQKAPDVLKEMSASGAEELLNLVKDEFRTETDPYGKRWKPKQADDGRKTLSGKTSRLKNFQIKRATKSGFTIAPTVDYAAPHQTGAPKRNLPQRMIVPTRGLPRKWSKALAEIAEEALARHFASPSSGGMDFVTGKIVGLKRWFSAKALLRKAIRAVQGE